LTPAALVALLKQNSGDLGAPGYDVYFGWGRVNAYKAALAAKGGASTADTTAPKVSLASPVSGATVAGTITISGTASDNIGVTQVQWFIDGAAAGSGTASAFSFSWNTATATNASHTITVKAFDQAGNVGSAAVQVTVRNVVVADTQAPAVKITSPASGAVVSRTTAISVSATDNVKVAKVAIYLNNVQVATCASASCSYSWNTRKAKSGSHIITATAWDSSGNVGHAMPVSVTK
jgi:Bacterial Ig domain